MTAASTEAMRRPKVVNISNRLSESAGHYPDKQAVVWPVGKHPDGRIRYAHVTFRELEAGVNAYARGLAEAGITRGMRTILMVRPGREFFALTFALFRIGAVPVLVDPGMGRRSLIACLAEVEAEAFVGIPLAHVARTIWRSAFRSVRIKVTVGRRWFWGGRTLKSIRRDGAAFESAKTSADDLAAILFTSGSTGPAKGACYTHGIFDAQVAYLNSAYGYSPEEVDLATFPLFALFDAALGMTAVIPEMNPSRPADALPENIIDAVMQHNVSHLFGSPALLDRLGRYGEKHAVRLETIKRVITAGAPIPPAVLERVRRMLGDEADVFTPYGATESLPVSSIESREILGETAEKTLAGRGICVGKPLDGIEARVIRINDEPIAEWSESLCVATNQIGEIVIKGPVVSQSYYRRPDATALAKIRDGDVVRHRMGDVGYLDEHGRIWFCGRKAHRVEAEQGTLFTIPCEAIFNQHENVRRSALVGIGPRGRQRPVLFVELESTARNADREGLTMALLALGAAHEHTRSIQTVLYHSGFPVDVRHNAKINRERLAEWATELLA